MSNEKIENQIGSGKPFSKKDTINHLAQELDLAYESAWCIYTEEREDLAELY